MAPPMPGLQGSTLTLRQSLHITVMCVALCCKGSVRSHVSLLGFVVLYVHIFPPCKTKHVL